MGSGRSPAVVRLYRYRSMGGKDDDPRVMPIFTEAKIYFPSRSQLNDPFECVVSSFETVKRAALRQLLRKGIKSEIAPTANRAERRRIEKQALTPNYLRALRADTQDLLDRAGILSFSAILDEPLLWSHYANGHRGICLEFDTAKLGYPALEVRYSTDYPEFDPALEGTERTARLILTKYKRWAYEREWRALDVRESGPGFGEHLFPPKSLTGVVFGAAISDADEKGVREWVARGPCKPSFYRAETVEGSFSITIKKLKP
jgi:hypothetical protein